MTNRSNQQLLVGLTSKGNDMIALMDELGADLSVSPYKELIEGFEKLEKMAGEVIANQVEERDHARTHTVTVVVNVFDATDEQAASIATNLEDVVGQMDGAFPDIDVELNDTEIEREDEEYVARCPICREPIDYCQGHGEIGPSRDERPWCDA